MYSCVILQLLSESLEPLRELRTIVSHAHFSSSLLSAQLELASAYARGYYGGLSETEALRFMREVFREAKNVLWERVYQLQENMTRNVRYGINVVIIVLLQTSIIQSCMTRHPL